MQASLDLLETPVSQASLATLGILDSLEIQVGLQPCQVVGHAFLNTYKMCSALLSVGVKTACRSAGFTGFTGDTGFTGTTGDTGFTGFTGDTGLLSMHAIASASVGSTAASS